MIVTTTSDPASIARVSASVRRAVHQAEANSSIN